jgi:hypothetical protein
VCGGSDWNAIGRDIETDLLTHGGNCWKASAHPARVEVSEREKHRSASGFGLAHDAARNNVTRRQITVGVVPLP